MAEAYPAYASTQEGDSAISMDGRSLVITRLQTNYVHLIG